MYKKTDELIGKMTDVTIKNNHIKVEHYNQHNVKRGLRNRNGTGVLVGLTKVACVHGYTYEDGKKVPTEGKLLYRGIPLKDLANGFQSEGRFGFEETVFLLLFGYLPKVDELDNFTQVLGENRELPEGFTENMILKIPSKDIMNKIQRSILVLYSHDKEPDNVEVGNLLRQSIKLIGLLPTIASYGYQAKSHYFDKKSLFIHQPCSKLSTSENILHMIRGDNKYSRLEAETLDLLLVIHAEHGGGNNSAFTTSVISSTGTDTYSAMSAAVGALKGPKHGGANIKVAYMIEDIKANCDYRDLDELKAYLLKIYEGQANDRSGLIYGMGHAVYTKSDPRAVLLKEKAKALAEDKEQMVEFDLYANVEALTKEIFKEKRGNDFIISANTDLYSGLVYQMLNIPKELYTPMFAIARIAGWCAHRIEQILSDPRILRPAYACVEEDLIYENIEERS